MTRYVHIWLHSIECYELSATLSKKNFSKKTERDKFKPGEIGLFWLLIH